jgi:hypothetical protein
MKSLLSFVLLISSLQCFISIDIDQVKELVNRQFETYFVDCVAFADTFVAGKLFYNDLMDKKPQATDQASIIDICDLTKGKVVKEEVVSMQIVPGGNQDYKNIAVIFSQTVLFKEDSALAGLSGLSVQFEGTIVESLREEIDDKGTASLKSTSWRGYYTLMEGPTEVQAAKQSPKGRPMPKAQRNSP